MHDEKEQDWGKIVALLYADKRRESMLVFAPAGEFNCYWLVETFDDVDEGVRESVAGVNIRCIR